MQFVDVDHSTRSGTKKFNIVVDEQSMFYVPDKLAPHVVVDVFLLLTIKRVLFNKHDNKSYGAYNNEESSNNNNNINNNRDAT